MLILALATVPDTQMAPELDQEERIQLAIKALRDGTIPFDQYPSSQIKGKYRLLILDGHTSHVSLPFIEYCEEHNIIPLCLPPHSTHILQPLDVGIFSPLAKAYKSRIQQNSIHGTKRITNEQFLMHFQAARQETISARNIESA